MTQMLEPRTCSIPARRQSASTVPVLIRVPALAGGAVGGRTPAARRRRLRREVRVAGCWLLALLPPGAALAAWGGPRPAPLLAVNSPDRPAPPTISLSLEPAVAAQPVSDPGCSVALTGQLLPADCAEEPAHGGY